MRWVLPGSGPERGEEGPPTQARDTRPGCERLQGVGAVPVLHGSIRASADNSTKGVAFASSSVGNGTAY